jgi:hypothetical protein
MQQALPDGGQLRYSYNNGQETIHVRLKPTKGAAAGSSVRQGTTVRAAPRLAIDVVFEPELFLSGDVYSKTVSTVTKYEWVWVDGDPIPVDLSELAHGVGPFWNGTNFDDPLGSGNSFGGEFLREQEIIQTITIVSGENRNPATDYDIAILQSVAPSRTLGIFVYVVSYVHFKANSQFGESSYWLLKTLDEWDPSMGYEPNWHGRLGDPYTVDAAQHVRDQVSFFDTVNVVGARVVADDETYEAVSTGAGADRRLRSLTQAGADATIARVAAIGAPPPGFWGAGFLATPRKTIDPTDAAPAPTTIEVWVAAMNTIKANTFPGPIGATFAADDPSFTYDTKRDLRLHVAVREFVDGGGSYVVRVSPAAQKRTKHWTAAGVDQPPSIEGANVDSDSGRDESWKFAATKGWRDLGGAPTDPAAPGMGALLADSGPLTPTVAAHVPSPRAVNSAPSWSGSVTGMTLIATIVWTPPSRPHEHGTATIAPA